MPENYDERLRARLTVDSENRVRGINHVDAFWESPEGTARATAISYLRDVATTFALPEIQLDHAHQPADFRHPQADRGTELRSSEEKMLFDSTTEGFYQTHRNVPVWSAGTTVLVKHHPLRVVSATSTLLDGLAVELPEEDVVARWRALFEQADADRRVPTQGVTDEPSPTAALVADVLAGRAFRRASKQQKADDDRRARLLSGRFFIYRYDAEDRFPHPRRQQPDPIGLTDRSPDDPALTGAPGGAGLVDDEEPTLDLPAVDRLIRDGEDRLVAELVFELETPQWGDINWRALVDVATSSVLYLRSMAASVNGLVFRHDPVSESGSTTNGPAATAGTLDAFRDDVLLPRLDAPVGGVQSLRGTWARLDERESPTVGTPTTAAGTDFDFGSRTNDFAAVNAYFHTDRFFELVADMGFPATYWGGTVFPVPVDHRGFSGNGINAHCVGDATGITHLCYALADTGDLTNPIGIAADWRVHLHELGGHGILYPHVGGPNFGFAHSAGDSMAVILTDPEGAPPDRFLLTPFVPAITRRHDRPVSSWAWDGPNDVGGYSSEQVLSTTLFRVYRSLGGDSADLGRRRFAARYVAYLILRTVGTLTAVSNPGHARDFANAMIAADVDNWTSEGLSGNVYGKVVRWSFEKQGLRFDTPFPAAGSVTTQGPPPAVDVYIEDGRGGEYGYQPVHWATTSIWNRRTADGGTTHQEPVLGQRNYAYAKVKNRGTQTAHDVVVRGFHTKPTAGLLWPDDFEAFDTPQLAVGDLAPNSTQERLVGPFAWEPNINAYGHDCMLMVVTATGDPSNVDTFVPGEVVAEWRLVPNDNNVAQRNVMPVPGGAFTGLIAGLHGFPMWVGNPNPRRAVLDIDVHLPGILRERGWRLGFEGLASNRLTLASRAQRELRFDLEPGAPFEKADVEATDDRDVVVTVRADGVVIGGMTYRLDPTLTTPVNPLGGRPGKEPKRCAEHATRLLECLDLHGQDVARVRVKKVTVDITMDGDCC